MKLNKSKVARNIIFSPGSKQVEIKEIELSNIYVPQSVKGSTVNKARYKGLNSNHINKLAESLSKGIDYSKPLPIVVKKEQWVDGKYYEYELVAGAHRFEAMRKNKETSWLFDVYVVGIDNDMRSYFFGKDASTIKSLDYLKNKYANYVHFNYDIRKCDEIKKIFHKYNSSIEVIIHAAAQPSHDWAANEPITDFAINASATINLLELMRNYSSESVFIFTSTNKVYGDTPNFLPLIEKETRWELDENHKWFVHGIDETMNIDNSKHSLFGASKLAADIVVQEYGKYFNLKTGIFRGGCLTGPSHAGAQQHGFLSYLIKCLINRNKYYVYGYKGKQVRDNIHSKDLMNFFWNFIKEPECGEVYNVGGSRFSNCSIIEAIRIAEEITGLEMDWSYDDKHRSGDHIWWISDIRKFQNKFNNLELKYNIKDIIQDIIDNIV